MATTRARLRPGDRVHYWVWAFDGHQWERIPREATVRTISRRTVRVFTVHDGPKIFTLPIEEVTRA